MKSSGLWLAALVAALGLLMAASAPSDPTPFNSSADPAGGPPLHPLRYRPPQCSNQSEFAGWSVAQLAAQLVIVPAEEDDLGAADPEVAGGAGGVLLFGSSAPADLGSQVQDLDRLAPAAAPLVMTDEEGGGVQRMANLVGSIPWARQMGSSMTAGQIERLAKGLGKGLLAAGVTVDLAPVLDVDGGPGPSATDPDGARSFSATPAVAATDGLAFAAGLEAAGVIPVVKHFPGLGGSSGNTDDGPAATLPYAALLNGGLVPFEQAVSAGVPAVMVSNASVPGLAADPASISPQVIDGLLIKRLGFSGLIMTDSLSAGAISALHLTVPQAAVKAIAAGADMVMFSSGSPSAVMLGVEDAVQQAVAQGQISRSTLQSAAGKVLAAKRVDLCLSPVVTGPG